jgi:hypothetical protein
MRTVFVIGAGSNVEIGMPSGNELKDKITNSLNFIRNDHDGTFSGDKTIFSALHTYTRGPGPYGNIYADRAGNLFDTAINISKAMSLSISIDNYIEAHKGNKQIELCGKLAIVSAILNAEQRCVLFDTDDKSLSSTALKRRAEKLKDSWYPLFFQKITEGCHFDELEPKLNDISFIIFNYDRCFEYFMYNSLITYYNIDHDRAKKIVSQLHINHPYGTVGDLWDNKDRITFGKATNATQLLQLANKIKTFTESETTDKEQESNNRIQYLVERTNRIIFLGFAYHDQNLDLLFNHHGALYVMDGVPMSDNVICYGTGHSISEKDLRQLSDMLKIKDRRISDIDIPDITCSKFFHDFWRRLSFK